MECKSAYVMGNDRELRPAARRRKAQIGDGEAKCVIYGIRQAVEKKRKHMTQDETFEKESLMRPEVC